jgi:predicted hotdog family 3-hydroxylacyl-ACP dehydratase
MLNINVADYLPWRDPILLISEVYEITADYAVAGSVVKSTWPLSNSETVNSLVLVEAIGQTAALAENYTLKSCSKGWVIGYKSVKIIKGSVPVNSTIVLTAKCILRRDVYAVIEGTAKCGGELVVTATIQAMRIKDADDATSG